MENQQPEQEYIFCDEGIKNISELVSVVQRIRIRMISEGISINDAKKDFFAKHPGFFNNED